MADCKNCYKYECCLIENTSVAIRASKEGMKASCDKYIHKGNYENNYKNIINQHSNTRANEKGGIDNAK